MSYVQPVACGELRVILCMTFDRHASQQRVAAFKAAMLQSPNNLHSVEATGTFDFMIEIAAPSMAWYHHWLETIGELASDLITRCDASFVCKRYIRRPEDDAAIWVPCKDGLRRVACSLIDKITAEGDYVRVHSRGKNWMLHATLHSTMERLTSDSFVQLHRSTVVRCDFIDHLVHEGRNWTAEMHDGSRQRIARSQIAHTLDAIKARSAIPVADSSDADQPVEMQLHV